MAARVTVLASTAARRYNAIESAYQTLGAICIQKNRFNRISKTAMKSGDTKRREALRLLMAAFKQVEVDQRKDLTESDAISILTSEAKKRREAIEEAEKAGRVALGEQEKYELALIEAYLPAAAQPRRDRKARARSGAGSRRDHAQRYGQGDEGPDAASAGAG